MRKLILSTLAAIALAATVASSSADAQLFRRNYYYSPGYSSYYYPSYSYYTPGYSSSYYTPSTSYYYDPGYSSSYSYYTPSYSYYTPSYSYYTPSYGYYNSYYSPGWGLGWRRWR